MFVYAFSYLLAVVLLFNPSHNKMSLIFMTDLQCYKILNFGVEQWLFLFIQKCSIFGICIFGIYFTYLFCTDIQWRELAFFDLRVH